MHVRSAVCLSEIPIPEDAAAPLPTEFVIFRAGVNASSKGPVLFDAAAAAAVMARYAQDGRDLMIDLEHEALDVPVLADSRDARGWFKLALRGGDLYAVDVRWTPDGERRLRERAQRYISPAFTEDKEGRPTWLVNVALCAIPALRNAPALVAARADSVAETKRALRLALGAVIRLACARNTTR